MTSENSVHTTAATRSAAQPPRVHPAARAWAWWSAGLAFAAYPALRPWGDVDGGPASALAAMATTRWLVAHLVGMLGFALLPVGLLALRSAGTAGRSRLLTVAAVLAYGGAVGVLPYYGGEAFGLHAVGTAATATGDLALAPLVDGFRYQPAALTLFGLGLLLLAAAGVVALLATRGADRPWRLAVGVVAVGLLTYLPQFFGSPALRVGHGVLLGLGCWTVALLVGRAQGSSTSLPRT